MAELLGRSRIRLRQQAEERHVEKHSDTIDLFTRPVRLFSEEPTSFAVFDEGEPTGRLTPRPPEAALSYFRGLVPQLGVNPAVWPGTTRRKAFTLAAATEETLLDRVQDLLSGRLESGAGFRAAPGEIDDLIEELGVTPKNPQYSEMVMRTNFKDAYSTGAWDELQESADFFPVWRYSAVAGPLGDGRNRPTHLAHHGHYYPNDVPFAEVRGTGPEDVCNDRCDFIPVSRYEWARLQKQGTQVSEFGEKFGGPGSGRHKGDARVDKLVADVKEAKGRGASTQERQDLLGRLEVLPPQHQQAVHESLGLPAGETYQALNAHLRGGASGGNSPISFKPEEHAGRLASSLDRIDAQQGGQNLVHLGDLRDAHPELSKPQFDAALHESRKQGKVTLSAFEGRHGSTERDRQSAVYEPDASGRQTMLGYASLRKHAEKFGGVGSGIKGHTTTRTTKKGETLHAVTRGEDKVWRTEDGQPVPEHIQKLGIPPAWKEVYINPDPHGDLMASGVDEKGRTQPKYSDTHSAQQAASKFGRTRELIPMRQKIYGELDRDAQDPKLKDRAETLRVVMQTGMRPGSDSDTKAAYKSYGATTLEGRHVVTKEDGSTALRLVTGKNKGREVEFPIHDKATAAMLQERAKAAGPDGRMFDTNASALRDYSKSKDGGGFKTKDHRTALGTETAIREIKSRPVPANEKEYKAAVKQVAEKVSITLGNTPPVALKSYIDPQVFAHWHTNKDAA